MVFGVCKLIDILVPDIPASLDIKIKRERYLAKEALQVSHQQFELNIVKIIKFECIQLFSTKMAFFPDP